MEKSWLGHDPIALDLPDRQPRPERHREQNDFSAISTIEKPRNAPPFFEYDQSSFGGLPFSANGPLSTTAVPFDFSFLRTSHHASSEPWLAERPTSLSQPNKRQKIAPCGSPVPDNPSECCSSCSDGLPCVDPDCEAEEEGLSCADPNCDAAREAVIICDGEEGRCPIPVCTSQCIAALDTQASLLGTGNWAKDLELPLPDLLDTYHKSDQFSAGMVQALHNFPPSESPAPTTPSMGNNISTPYSPHMELQPPQDGQSSYPKSGVEASQNMTSLSISSAVPGNTLSGDIYNEPWNSSGDKTTMFCCPWEGCNQPLESDEWMSHFHREHIDPQMTFRCPFQEETCPPVMDTNPLAHLETDHGYIFDSNGNGYSCPSPTCPQDLTFCDPSTLHNHLDYAHATPGSGALRCRLNSCDNWFEDSNQLVSHVNEHHPLTALLHRDEAVDLSEPSYFMKAWKDNIEPLSQTRSSKKDSVVEPAQSLNGKDGISDLVHSCKWVLPDGKVCSKSCDSETDLQVHIKEAHLESLDNKTGYYCRWEGCLRDSKLGVKAGFSQRGKLERHMATHTNFKCSKCDICGKDFSAPQAMKQHRRLHTGERPWKCQHCNKTFAQQSACTVHERTHTNEKPLECPICHKKFSESSNLAKHRKTHGEKGSHACKVAGCGKSYHRYDQLKRHMATHHVVGAVEKGSEESESQDEEGL